MFLRVSVVTVKVPDECSVHTTPNIIQPFKTKFALVIWVNIYDFYSLKKRELEANYQNNSMSGKLDFFREIIDFFKVNAVRLWPAVRKRSRSKHYLIKRKFAYPYLTWNFSNCTTLFTGLVNVIDEEEVTRSTKQTHLLFHNKSLVKLN